MSDQKSSSAYDRYRTIGNLALVIGAAIILLLILAQLFDRPGYLAPQLSVPLGLALMWIGYLYRHDLPNIYARMADLEQRLQSRIDAIGTAQSGNGKQK